MLKITRNSHDSKAFWLKVDTERGSIIINLGNQHGPISHKILVDASEQPSQPTSPLEYPNNGATMLGWTLFLKELYAK